MQETVQVICSTSTIDELVKVACFPSNWVWILFEILDKRPNSTFATLLAIKPRAPSFSVALFAVNDIDGPLPFNWAWTLDETFVDNVNIDEKIEASDNKLEDSDSPKIEKELSESKTHNYSELITKAYKQLDIEGSQYLVPESLKDLSPKFIVLITMYFHFL